MTGMKKHDKEYSDAFNGVEPEAQPTNAAPEGEDGAAPVAVVLEVGADPEMAEAAAAEAATGEGAPETGGEVMNTPPAETAAAAEPAGAAPSKVVEGEEVLSPEDEQRKRSWEGRLRKREEELAAKEAALSGAQATDEPAAGESEQVARLREDFGDEFVDGIKALVSTVVASQVKELVGEGRFDDIKGQVDSLIGELQNTFGAMHREAIIGEIPDADEIAASPEFQKWCSEHANPEECRRIIESGSAREVVKLLKEFSAHLSAQDNSGPTDAEDAASTVSGSAPLKLPTRAAVSDEDEYRAAFNSM